MADGDTEKASKKVEETPMTFGESFDSNWGPKAMERQLEEEAEKGQQESSDSKKKKRVGES